MRIDSARSFIVVHDKDAGKALILSVEAIDSIEPMFFTNIEHGGVVETEEWSRITIRRNKKFDVVEKVSYFIGNL